MLSLAVCGAIIATLVAPGIAGWYFTPPAGGVVMMKGDEAVRWGIRQLIHAQLVGLALGAALGLLVGIKTRRKPDAIAATPTLPAVSAPTVNTIAASPTAPVPARK